MEWTALSVLTNLPFATKISFTSEESGVTTTVSMIIPETTTVPLFFRLMQPAP